MTMMGFFSKGLAAVFGQVATSGPSSTLGKPCKVLGIGIPGTSCKGSCTAGNAPMGSCASGLQCCLLG